MHDLTFAKEIVRALNIKQNSIPNGSRITSINAALSPLSHVKPETLTETFRVMTKGTELDKIGLNIKVLKIELTCRTCKHAFQIDKPTTRCVKCNDSDLDMAYSKEFVIESINVADNQSQQKTS
ncbi:MAG: hydrogenase maturation nickel metallochaperone HypA [Candidatus Omnitrophica bacterium]|nr:hydrogenase maturation nickel metallochaperone HypA [Candidatus Omnitrophota bacterium]MBU0881658.1 hydrogenase maturation nickel metallochaperone HypA [Candidatus Omnitrophota bacterium]MBU1808146.1 hydrogenase maturation nickel metallochaperone HypA [Candidatus Omnitrophota bacterium]